MMISDADFDELFFGDSAPEAAIDGKSGAANALRRGDSAQMRSESLRDANALAMMDPFGAALAMMSVFGVPQRT